MFNLRCDTAIQLVFDKKNMTMVVATGRPDDLDSVTLAFVTDVSSSTYHAKGSAWDVMFLPLNNAINAAKD